MVTCSPQKHLLLESWVDLSDNVEKELLYFQVLYTLRADKFPVKQVEAVSSASSSVVVFIFACLLSLTKTTKRKK